MKYALAFDTLVTKAETDTSAVLPHLLIQLKIESGKLKVI